MRYNQDYYFWNRDYYKNSNVIINENLLNIIYQEILL